MPVKRNAEMVGEIEGRGVSIMRGYRNGRLVFRHTSEYSPYNPYTPNSTLRFRDNENIVRLMNPVEDVSIS